MIHSLLKAKHLGLDKSTSQVDLETQYVKFRRCLSSYISLLAVDTDVDDEEDEKEVIDKCRGLSGDDYESAFATLDLVIQRDQEQLQAQETMPEVFSKEAALAGEGGALAGEKAYPNLGP